MPNRRSIRSGIVATVGLFAFLAGSLLQTSFSPCGPACAAEPSAEQKTKLRERLKSNVLRWAGDAEGGAPYQFYEADAPTKLVGFEVELVEAVVAELRKTYDLPELQAAFVQYNWVSLPQGLTKGDFDVIVSGYEITADNLSKVRMSRPYYLFWQQLTIRSDDLSITSLEECRTKRIGTLAGSAAAAYLESRRFPNVTGYSGQIEPYQDLTNKRIDAVLLDSPIAIYNAGGKPMLRLIGKPEIWSGYGVAARPNEDVLIAAIDTALDEVIKSGTADAILRRWNIWNDEEPRLAQLNTPEALITWSGSTRTKQEWTFSKYAPLLLKAALVTIELTFLSMAVAMGIGLVVAVCRLFGPAPVKFAALVFVEFFRGIPLLLLLTFLYYGLPTAGLTLSAWSVAIIAFGLNYAAFEAEIYRSSILGVPQGQWEAARALGMDGTTTFRRIIFPQAIRTALGPMTNDFVAMFKDTSLVSVIAVVELTTEYQILARTSSKFVEIGLLTAVLYLAMSVPLGYLARYLEHRWSGGVR